MDRNEALDKVRILKSTIQAAGKQYVDESDLDWLEIVIKDLSQPSISVDKLLYPDETAHKKALDFISDVKYLGTEKGTEKYEVPFEDKVLSYEQGSYILNTFYTNLNSKLAEYKKLQDKKSMFHFLRMKMCDDFEELINSCFIKQE